MDLLDPAHHARVIASCASDWNGAPLVLATPPGLRYPYAYPRDMAGLARAMLAEVKRGKREKEALQHLESAAEFLLAAQRPDGSWGQRYDLSGEDKSIYRQEDNVAHGKIVIGSYLEAARHLGVEPPRLADALDALARARAFARRHVYRPGINLYYSTTSVHESGIETGYTLWTNCAFLRSMVLHAEALRAWDPQDALLASIERESAELKRNVRRHFVQDGLFLRRVTARGRYDRRPDVTLLSPFYFGFADLDSAALSRSVERVEKDLTDPDLGLLQRYLPFAEDITIHLHAGNGPWLAYSAIFAQYHAERGDAAKARETLTAIAAYATPDGFLPEHLSTRERFEDFMEREWETGLDFRKEFSEDILLPRVPFSTVCEELMHMRDEYERIRARVAESGDAVIRFATPLMWSHAEFLGALEALAARRA